MGRKKRDFVKNGIYHITQRSIKDCFAFKEPYDKAMLLKLMDEARLRHPFELLYYVVMDNHVHYLIRMTEGNLSVAIGQINRCFARYYNRKNDRKGQLFDDRFRSTQIHGTSHLLTAIEYIANNPVKAGIVEEAADYRWGGHNEVLAKQICYIDRSALLRSIDYDESKALRIYLHRISPAI